MSEELLIDKNELTLNINTQKRTLLIDGKYKVVLKPRLFAVFMLIISRMKRGVNFSIPISRYRYSSFIESMNLLAQLFEFTIFDDANFYKKLDDCKNNELQRFTDALTKRRLVHDVISSDILNGDFKSNDENWLYNMIVSTNDLLTKRNNNKNLNFIVIKHDPLDSGRNHHISHPINYNKDTKQYQLNKRFLLAQHNFWLNAFKEIKKEIIKTVENLTLAKNFIIKHVEGTYKIDIASENIIIY
jgi:hypothetical protein